MIGVAQAKRFFAARRDWLGDGGTFADLPTAQRRADTCLACPKHAHKPWQELVTASVAGYVRRQLELKAHLRMRVEREEELHTCDMCQCWLPLKTWLPLDKARAITPDWQSFPTNCWLHSLA